MKFIHLCLVALAAAACTKQPAVEIPLPHAYPRPALPDTAMVAAPDAPLHFLVNSQAVVSSPRPGWLDVAYPQLGATVHITFSRTDASEIETVKENRMERLILNAGERPTDFAEFTNNAGFNVLLAQTDGATTPIQFLATDNTAWVASGAVYFASPDATTAVDSLRPMLTAIRRDLARALQALQSK